MVERAEKFSTKIKHYMSETREYLTRIIKGEMVEPLDYFRL
jgi:hypothetical protein